MGVEAKGHEVDELFDTLDEDGGGSLDTQELKVALKKLQDLAEESKSQIRQQAIQVLELAKVMKTQQASYQQQRKRDRAAEAKEAEKRAREAEELAAAVAQQKEARLAAAAEKKAAAAAEKAAFEAKIAARRSSSTHSLP